MAMRREEFTEQVAQKLEAAAAREARSPEDERRHLQHEAASRASWEQHAENDEFRERVLAKLDELADRPRSATLTREEFLEATAGYDE